MILSYLKLSLRLLARKPFLTFTKVSGLTIGIAIFFVLWEYTQNEMASDHQWKDADRIYRIGTKIRWTDDKANWEESYFATNFVPLASQITSGYAEITDVTRILFQQNFSSINEESSYVTQHGTNLFFAVETGSQKKFFKEKALAYADPNVFSFFGLQLLAGDPKTALSLAGSIVLSEKIALKYFGTTQVIGKTLLINDQIPLIVSGVMYTLPRNTHLLFDALSPVKALNIGIRIFSGQPPRPQSTI